MATSTVPISVIESAADSALATHEVLDEAAHQQIATEVDEDYKWLTDRLDAQEREINLLRQQLSEMFQSRTSELMTAFDQSQSQSRTLLETQAQMITTLTENLTALSASALLRSTLPNSENTSTETLPATETIAVVETVPADSAATQVSSEAEGPRYKRRRI